MRVLSQCITCQVAAVQLCRSPSEETQGRIIRAWLLRSPYGGLLLISGCLVQVLQAKTKVANGKVFDLAVKLSQGDMPDQIMQVS